MSEHNTTESRLKFFPAAKLKVAINMQKELPHVEITYLEADENYTVIHYKDGSQVTYGYTLKVFEQKLTASTKFRRIHRKYLVNYEYVRHRFEASVLMKNGIELPVSRRRR